MTAREGNVFTGVCQSFRSQSASWLLSHCLSLLGCGRYASYLSAFLIPPANEVCEGYVFTRVCLSTGEGWYPSMPCRSRGGGIPAYLVGLQAQTWGRLRGLARGVSRPTPRGRLRVLTRGVSRPTPRGEVEGSGQGGLQAHTQREVEGSSQGWSPGPHPGGRLRGLARGVSRPTPRGSPSPHLEGSPGPHLGQFVHPNMH